MQLVIEKPPENHYFKIENFGKGWLIMSLRRNDTKEAILSAIIPRPLPEFYNTRTSNYMTDSLLEVTQPSDIKATAIQLIEEFKELNNNSRKNLNEIEKINKEDYIGEYN